jgi:photosystem II stability/assembly factor-like uncharacterized protein
VRQVQERLAKLGFYKGPADGVVGPALQAAIRAFQQKQGLPADGILDPRTTQELGLSGSTYSPAQQAPVPPNAPRELNIVPDAPKKASELPSFFPEARAAMAPEQNALPAQKSPPVVQRQAPPIRPAPEPEPAPRGIPDLNAVFFLPDGLTGWVAGGDGTLLRTTDGGATWSPQKSNTRFELTNIVFRDARNGLAVGGGGTILHTADGGATWAGQESDASFRALSFGDARNAWVVGVGGTILRTTDGGTTWAPQTSRTRASLNSVAFTDARNGWAVGERGTILHTADGGATWALQASGTQVQLNEVAFSDTQNGWAVGEGGITLRTTDGGASWTIHTSGTDASLMSVTFSDARNGWAVGVGGTVLRTGDGGVSWSRQTSGPEHDLSSVMFSDARNGWAVSDKGTILRTVDGGVSWTPQASGTGARLQSVVFIDGRNGWVAGGEGSILRTSDSGTTWVIQPGGGKAFLRAVAFSDERNGWAVGGEGTILRTTDGGATWTLRPSGTKEWLVAVAFSDERNGCAVGSAGTILRTSDGGTTWTAQRSGTKERLTSVVFSDERNGWAAGNSGTILRSADGGATWVPQASGSKRSLNSIAFSDARNGWVAGEGGTLLHTADGGATWAPQASGTRADLNAVTFIDARNGWAVGAGAILRTVDGGKIWLGGESPNVPPLVTYARFPAPWWYLALLAGFGSLGMALRPPRPQVRAVASVADLALSDRPLEAGDRDALNFHAIALGLSNFLRNAATEPPLTLSITGDWGSGKSSLMNLLREDLRSRGFRPVWFNPWHQPKEANLLAALIATIRAQALPPLASAEGLRFRWQLAWVRTRERPLWVAAMVFLAAWLVTYFGMKPAHLTAAIEWLPHFAKVLKADDEKAAADLLGQFKSFAALVAILGPLLTAWRGLKAFGVNPGALAVTVAGSLKQADAQSRFLNDYARQFQEVASALRPRTLAIFMDDLDRCPPDRVREALEAVNYLVSSGPCFVVLGMARERVEACVGLAFKDVAQEMVHLARLEEGAAPVLTRPPDDEARRHRRHYARDYLKKLVNIEIPVPAPNEGQAKGLVGAAPDASPPAAEPAWRSLARTAAGAWPLVMVVAVAVFGWWSAVKTPDVAPPAPAPAIEAKPAGDPVMPSTAPAGATRKDGDSGTRELDFREAYVVSGQRAPLPVPVWLVPLAVLLAGAGLTLLRRPQVVEQDSRDFRRSLANWLPLVAARQNTPREVKRFVNRVRLLAMRQRAEGRNPARLDEPTLVALAALHHVDESLLDPLPPQGAGAGVATRLTQAGHAWGYRIAVPLDASLAAHATEAPWPPGPDEVELFRALVGSVRLD